MRQSRLCSGYKNRTILWGDYMSKKIIIVEGYLAAGKSTFTCELSKAINVPYLIKDTFKMAVCTTIPITNRTESSRFSAVTFDAMMYVVERLMETANAIIIEGNFAPIGMKKTDEASVIKALINKYGYQPLTYKFTGNLNVLYERFIERDSLPERGDANRMFVDLSYDDFERYCHNLDGFSVGGDVIVVDTTDFENVDFAEHIESACEFMQ